MEITKESIKNKIAEYKTIREILFYLDVCEKEVKDRFSELYMKTRMDDFGDFLPGENGWEYFFEYREFNPEYMLSPPLTKDQQKQYLKDFGKEIKEAQHLHNVDYFIKDQKKFYEKQLVKYSLMDDINRNGTKKNKGFELYDFDYDKILEELGHYESNEDKLEYLEFIKKEINIIKYALNTTYLSEIAKDGQKEITFTKAYKAEEFLERLNRIIKAENNNIIKNALQPILISYEKSFRLLSKEPIEEDKKKENVKLIINLNAIEEKLYLLKRTFLILEKKIDEELEYITNRERRVGMQDTDGFEKYLDYSKECYLNTWEDDRIQLLSFEKKMIEKFGREVEKYVVRLFNHIDKNINPIEFLGCDIEKFKKNKDSEKLQDEIIRIKEFIGQIEILALNTANESGLEGIPEDELDKLSEWQSYYIKGINNAKLRQWIEYLRNNRPGVYEQRYGESYKVDFSWVTEFALKEFSNYKDRLENLKHNIRPKNNLDVPKQEMKQLKQFGRGELQKALEPLAIEFKLSAGESAKSTKVRLITKRLIEQNWDANEPSVSEALRKMGFVKGRRK